MDVHAFEKIVAEQFTSIQGGGVGIGYVIPKKKNFNT